MVHVRRIPEWLFWVSRRLLGSYILINIHRESGSKWATWLLECCKIAITGQSLPIFIQVVRSLRISARILVSRFESRSRRERESSLGSERRNIISAC